MVKSIQENFVDERKAVLRHLSILILMLFGLLLAGCSARPDAGLTAALGESGLVLDLPAITVDYDETGAPTLAGVTPAELAAVLPGGLDRLRLPSAAIEVASNAGIQHIQASNTPQGLRLFVNGAALPGLAWDAARLQNAAALAAQFGLTLPPEIVDLLPILPQLGIGVTVHFPHPADAAAIPPASADVSGAAFQTAQRAALTMAGSRPVLHIPVHYRENGSFLVNEVTDAQWQALTGLPWGALRFDEATLADLQRLGVREIRLSADERGLHLDFDGKPLPYLAWDRGEVAQTLALVENLGLLGALTGDDEQPAALDLLAPWLPLLQTADITIQVYLPE
jgi:hypothetical protein